MKTRLLCLPVFLVLLTAGTKPADAQTAKTIKDTLPKMVKIFGAGKLKGLHAYGTGFFVSPQGHIATIWNHVLDSDEVTVILSDGRKYQAKLVGAEPQIDLAIIKIDTKGNPLPIPYFDLKKAGEAGPGTRVLAFSNMFKVATGDEPVSVLHGVISAKSKLSARRGVFELPYDGDAYIVDAITNNPGSGGGALMSRDGQLLAMVGREVRNTETNTWMNYAVPITELRETVEQIISGNFIRKPKKEGDDDNPGRYNPLDFGLVMVPDVVVRTPAYIDSILPGSQAAKMGLRPEDLVLFVNDELIQSSSMLSEQLGRLEGGDRVKFLIRRGSKLINVTFDVPKKPDAKTN